MKAIMVMFDSLNRHFLEPYGTTTGTKTPNFVELAKRTVQFDTCFVGSLPCMPARRELHTGRYNFLHAPWGYVEPFDDSVPQILHFNGIHTHLISDHYHYWENAGGNYHCHYQTWDAVRGQEGDPWVGMVGGIDTPRRNHRKLGPYIDLAEQDMVNRTVWNDNEENRPVYRTFTKGLEFLEINKDRDNWMLTIETFDPHEPFDAPERFKEMYPDDYEGELFDWDTYGPVKETPEEVEHLRNCYSALVSFCDEQLGRIIKFMDEEEMWEDTMLIVCTDHGHFLSERGFWAKNYMPVYNELANIPLFIWDPRNPITGERRQTLVQTIDIPATVLDFFNVKAPSSMQGKSITSALKNDSQIRESGLFGYFGQMTCLVDGDYIFMRAPHTANNAPLNKYTWMLYSGMGVDVEGDFDFQVFNFSKSMPIPKIPILSKPINGFQNKDLLFNIKDDPNQEHPIQDIELTEKMCRKMAKLMQASEAPQEQYERLGLAAYIE